MNTAPRRYRVTVTREDHLWVAVVGGLAGGATDVEHFGDLGIEVRDLIAGLADIDPEEISIEWRYVQGDHEYTPAVEGLREWEQGARKAIEQRDAARRAAIVAMRNATLSFRDIADIVGLSHQRVAQLVSEYDRQAS